MFKALISAIQKLFSGKGVGKSCAQCPPPKSPGPLPSPSLGLSPSSRPMPHQAAATAAAPVSGDPRREALKKQADEALEKPRNKAACNFYTREVLKGSLNDEEYREIDGKRAKEMNEYFAQESKASAAAAADSSGAVKPGKWRSVSADEAQRLANEGAPVVAGRGSHVAVVYPGEAVKAGDGKSYPRVIGGTINYTTEEEWKNLPEPTTEELKNKTKKPKYGSHDEWLHKNGYSDGRQGAGQVWSTKERGKVEYYVPTRLAPLPAALAQPAQQSTVTTP